MAILIDPPFWPAHGALWSHLVSDTSYDELHEFAARLAVPRRGFDLDHYDVPESMHARAVALGARAVGTRDVVHALRASGLRVRQVERDAARPVRRRQYLVSEWASLADLAGVEPSDRARDEWQRLGGRLIARWNEAHRRYHDERHLEDVLLSLDQLATRGERVAPVTLLAAWFHDAVYAGVSGTDERDSAALAAASLEALSLDPSLVAQVHDLVVATTPTIRHPDVSAPLAHLLDADLSIFGSSNARYLQYAEAVRAEYAHVPVAEFREGRAGILRSYLDQPAIYRAEVSRQLWEQRARVNLTREIADLLRPIP